VVHAFVEFRDGSVLAQLGFPTMELPILYALTHPQRLPDASVRRFDPVSAGPLTFEPLRGEVFRAFRVGVAAGRAGGTAPCAFNAANEEAVAAFLDGRISFGRIAELIDGALQAHETRPVTTLAAITEADREARHRVRHLMRSAR
jgi:1-deoxy-D-xylulose-5-phosphate reductoisomerase